MSLGFTISKIGGNNINLVGNSNQVTRMKALSFVPTTYYMFNKGLFPSFLLHLTFIGGQCHEKLIIFGNLQNILFQGYGSYT